MDRAVEESVMKSIAIVIPTFKSFDLTKKHLKLLKKQTCKNFDVIIAESGESNDYIKLSKLKLPFKLKLAYAKEDTGACDSFYRGFKLAYTSGYKYIMLADNDTLPSSENMIEELIKRCTEDTATVPLNYREKEGFKENTTKIMATSYHYLTLSSVMIDKIGSPVGNVFMYWDDVEYSTRISKNFTLLQLNYVYFNHRIGMQVFFDEVLQLRNIYYNTRNSIHLSRSKMQKIKFALISITLLLPIATLMYKSKDAFIYLHYHLKGIWDGMLGRTGKISIPKLEYRAEFIETKKLPRNIVYLTYQEHNKTLPILSTVNLKAGNVVFNFTKYGLNDFKLFKWFFSFKVLVVDDLITERYCSLRLLPFVLYRKVFIISGNKIWQVKFCAAHKRISSNL